MKGIMVLTLGIGLIIIGGILLVISILYRLLVGKKVIKELMDKYD